MFYYVLFGIYLGDNIINRVTFRLKQQGVIINEVQIKQEFRFESDKTK